MARSGRLVWIKLVLRAVPIYAMLAENLPLWAQQEIDAICRRFFWAGSDQSIKGKCMVAWQVCCKPTEFGGLGIRDIKLAGYALQTRWLWLQKVDQDRPWSQRRLRFGLSSECPLSFVSGTAGKPFSGKIDGYTVTLYSTSPHSCTIWCRPGYAKGKR